MLGLHEDDAPTWTAQAFVGGGSDHIGMRHRVGVDASGNESRVMRHVHQKDGTNLFGHFRKTRKVNVQAVGRGTGNDQLGAGGASLGFHRVVINFFFGVEAIAFHLEPLATHVQRHTVTKVTAFGQAHTHDGLAWFQKGQEHRLVGRSATVRLHIGGVCTKQLLDAVDGELLGNIYVFATAVVALARVALGVFIGQLCALRLHHSR